MEERYHYLSRFLPVIFDANQRENVALYAAIAKEGGLKG